MMWDLSLYAQEPLVLPSVTITGKDKSLNTFEAENMLPSIKFKKNPKDYLKNPYSDNLLFFSSISAGSYDCAEWHIACAKQNTENSLKNNTNFFISLDKFRSGFFGDNNSLMEKNDDNLGFELFFPIFKKASIFSSASYIEKNDSLSGQSVNVVQRNARDAKIDLGYSMLLGGFGFKIIPFYAYTGMQDQRVNIDTQVLLNQEISSGVKIDVETSIKSMLISSGFKYENCSRPEINKTGSNTFFYFNTEFALPNIQRLWFDLGFDYAGINSYLNAGHFNPQIKISYSFEKDFLLKFIFKSETILPSYDLFLLNYAKINPNLREEQDVAFMVEADKKFIRDDKINLDGSLQFFHKSQENIICYSGKANLWQPVNLQRLDQFGFDAKANFSYILFGGTVHAKADYILRQFAVTGEKTAPYVPLSELKTAVGYEIGPLRFELEGVYRGLCSADTQTLVAMQDYFVTNLYFSYTITKNMTAFFKTENLFDVKYHILEDYPAMPQKLEGGIELRF